MQILINKESVVFNIDGVTINNNTLLFTKSYDEPIILKVNVDFLNLNIQIKNCNINLIFYNIDKKTNLTIDVLENSHLELFDLNLNTTNKEYKVNVKKNATFNKTLVTLNNSIYHDLVNLDEEAAFCNIKNLVINATSKSNISTYIDHKNKNTTSLVKNYAIALKQSNIDFNTTAKVNKGSVNSSCKQLTRGIILKDDGVIKSLPILKIDENDIEASHGTTIGKVNDDSLFYLMSRGLSERESLKLIISGMISPFLEGILDEEIKNELINGIDKIIK